jgi:hypothetical protein
LAESARPAGSDGSSGGETSFVEAGLSGIAPAAFRYSKKERTTDSLKATVEALFFCERDRSLQRITSAGTTSEGCFMPVDWKNSRRARPYARRVCSETDLLTKGAALLGSNLLAGDSPPRRISGVKASLDKTRGLSKRI